MMFRWSSHRCLTTALLVLAAVGVRADISKSAYRVLGQQDFRQNGLNEVQGIELASPTGIAVDIRAGEVHLYVSDSGNSRVLAWQNVRAYQTGDAPALVLGQPDPQSSRPLGIGVKGFSGLAGLAVDPTNGNLYVADAGNNRVLRFPSPFANPSRVEPDAVYGQPGFNTRTANAGGIGKNSLSVPRGVAFDSTGNLWIADTGNHRVLRFPRGVLDNAAPEADLVLGQPDFTSAGANATSAAVSASGFDSPRGLSFDRDGNIYVSDFNNSRVLKFAATAGLKAAAIAVYGQTDFTSRGLPPQASSSSVRGPLGLANDTSGRLYVATPADNRVLLFPAAGGAAVSALGQPDLTSTQANAGAAPQASPGSLFEVSDVKTDAEDNVYVADSRNNRVLMFSPGARSAVRIWGQNDFLTNGVNQIKPVSINTPFKITVDYSDQPYPLYVSDTSNNRILIWRDSVRFRNNDPADLVIGQPDLRTAVANIDSPGGRNPSQTSLSAPKGIALDSQGNLWVVDSGNNRVLRFPRPVRQSGRISADFVIGQSDFTSSVSAVVTASSLRSPAGVAVGSEGNIFVSDAGNNRVLEFAPGSTTAVRVYGQPNFSSSAQPSTVSPQTLNSPQGLYIDSGQTLYVSDAGANRILVFPDTRSAPFTGATAAFVVGQAGFGSVATSGLLKTPIDVTLDSDSNIYVSDTGNNRVLIFPSLLALPVAGGAANAVVGQNDLTGTASNWNNQEGAASAEGLSAPIGLFVDRRGTLYVGDAGNSRVLHFLRPASAVNAAHLQAGVPVARGSLVALFGTGLSEQTENTSGTPWPRSLAEREVVVNDEFRAPLLSMGPAQSNFQLPFAAPSGVSRIAVRVADTGELVAGGTVAIAASSPGIFTVSQDGKGQGAIVNQDGRVNSAANPAARGSVVTLYGTGQGQVSPPVADGVPAPSDALASTVAVPTADGRACLASQPSVCVAIGSGFGDIQYSGLAPGFVGLWQINVKIPESIAAGPAVSLRVVINAVPSNTVSINIR